MGEFGNRSICAGLQRRQSGESGRLSIVRKGLNSTDPLFDLNENYVVDFGDFVIFVRSFCRPLP